MALSAATALGRVDLPPSFIGTTGGQAKLSAFVLEFTVNAGGDYTAGTGVTYASIIALVNAAATATPPTVAITAELTNIVGVQVLNIRASSNAVKQVITFDNVQNTGVQAFTFTTVPAIAEYTVTAGDIWRVLIIGF